MDSSDNVLCISRLGRGRTSDSGRCGTIASLDAFPARLSLAPEPQTRLIASPALPKVPEKRRVSHAPVVARKQTSKRTDAPLSPSAKRRAKDTIPRPPNCFIIFRSRNKDTFSGLQKDVSVSAGHKWGEMSDDEKKPYKDLAVQAREEHKKMYPDYTYTPAEKGSKGKKAKAKMIDEGLEELEYPESASASTSTSGSGYPSPSSSASVIPSSPELMTPPLFSSPLINPDEILMDVDFASPLATTSALDEVAKYVDLSSFPAPADFQFDQTAFLEIYKGGLDGLPPAPVEEYPMSMSISGINDFNMDIKMGSGFDNFDWAGINIHVDLPTEGFGYDFDASLSYGF